MADTRKFEESVIKYINGLLKSKKMVNTYFLANHYLEYRPVNTSNEIALQMIKDFIKEVGERHLAYLSYEGLVFKLKFPDGFLYASKETLEEIRQLGQKYRSIKFIHPKFLGDRGVNSSHVSIMCKHAIPDFPFEYCNDDFCKLVNKNCAQEYTCNKCHKVYFKTYLYMGNKYCLECIRTIKNSVNSGQSVV